MTIQNKIIKGFSRLSRDEKLALLLEAFSDKQKAEETFISFRHTDPAVQQILEEFTENTISNYHFPYNVAPNFSINGTNYMVPMVTEESSVVAAAASAAGFWAANGGFHSRVISSIKEGQVHFIYKGDGKKLTDQHAVIEEYLKERTAVIEEKMRKRGGGTQAVKIVDMRHKMSDYFQLQAFFETADSMGANFINSCLEEFARGLGEFLQETPGFSDDGYDVIMSILSNYTPDCLVECYVECPVDAFNTISGSLTPKQFVQKFKQAVDIAGFDVSRATTHNKGIFNGMDAVILATGNDFRAVEAAAHAYASRNGSYQSLTSISLDEGIFRYTLRVPLAIGTTGGLTRLHPLAAASIELLGNPDAREMMTIISAAGLANNFSAIKSLITSGIQAGHMKMHLPNILRSFNASEQEITAAKEYFNNHQVSHKAVEVFLSGLRNK